MLDIKSLIVGVGYTLKQCNKKCFDSEVNKIVYKIIRDDSVANDVVIKTHDEIKQIISNARNKGY